jgi:Pyridoxamine 5'-phosphate oxidase
MNHTTGDRPRRRRSIARVFTTASGEIPMAKSTTASVSAPRIDRPAIPASYGTSKASEFVDWSHVEERLRADRVYWVATVGRGGRPRVRPIDGVYVDRVIYVGGSPETRWVGELADNPHVSVHLDGVDDVVIVEGEAEIMSGTTSPSASPRRRMPSSPSTA